jgi:hypothetical protein
MIRDTDLNALWAAFHAKRRKGSDTIKVSASSLGALLETHHALVSGGKLAVTLGPDHVSLVGELPPKDFEQLAKAVDQRRAFAQRNVSKQV